MCMMQNLLSDSTIVVSNIIIISIGSAFEVVALNYFRDFSFLQSMLICGLISSVAKVWCFITSSWNSIYIVGHAEA